MQAKSRTRARRAAIELDFDATVSDHMARRVRELVEGEQVQVWSIDGQDARERRDLLAAGRRFPAPTLIRGTVGTPPRRHRVQLEADAYGVPWGSCDCEAARWSRPRSHLWALACHAVALGWRSA